MKSMHLAVGSWPGKRKTGEAADWSSLIARTRARRVAVRGHSICSVLRQRPEREVRLLPVIFRSSPVHFASRR